jgi:hypothetical protein
MKHITIILTVVIAVLFVVSCENPATPPATETPGASTVTSVTITGGNISLPKGTTNHQFSATVEGTNNPAQTVTWSVTGSDKPGTTITGDGELSIASDETVTSLTVRATSTVDNTKYGEITVTVVAQDTPTVTSVTITGNTSVEKGSTYTFTASVQGEYSPSQAVTWSFMALNGSDYVITADEGTSITETGGLLTISSTETAAKLKIKATSVADTTKFGEITVTVLAAGTAPTVTGVTVTAVDGVTEIARGATLQFTAAVTVTNEASQAVTWSVAGKDKDGASVALTGTTIDEDGLLTVGANETAVDLVVTAASTVSGFTDKKGTAQVFVRKYQKVYLIGEDFGGWTAPTTGNYTGREMTYANRGVYTWTGTMLPNKTFKFHDDTANGWSSGNWFNATTSNAEPTGDLQVTLADSSITNNDWKTTQLGTYTISLDTTAGTVTFTRTELGATGLITLSIDDEGEGLALTGLSENLKMYKKGAPGSLTFTVTTTGYDYTWYVDDEAGRTGGTITLEAAQYNLGGHSVTLVAKNTNVFWSAEPILFKVEAEAPAPAGE